MPKDESREVLQESLLMQTAALSLVGASENEIHQKLNISRYAVRKMRNSAEFKKLVLEHGEMALSLSREAFRSKMQNLEPLAYSALKKNLEDNRMDAVKVFLQAVGALEQNKEEGAKDTSLTVILPGGNVVKEVKSDTIEIGGSNGKAE